jgi:hypothetical protein
MSRSGSQRGPLDKNRIGAMGICAGAGHVGAVSGTVGRPSTATASRAASLAMDLLGRRWTGVRNALQSVQAGAPHSPTPEYWFGHPDRRWPKKGRLFGCSRGFANGAAKLHQGVIVRQPTVLLIGGRWASPGSAPSPPRHPSCPRREPTTWEPQVHSVLGVLSYRAVAIPSPICRPIKQENHNILFSRRLHL